MVNLDELPGAGKGGEAKQCKCSLRISLVGDGCDVCNPDYARDLAEDDEACHARKEG